MRSCWTREPDERPRFADLVVELETLKEIPEFQVVTISPFCTLKFRTAKRSIPLVLITMRPLTSQLTAQAARNTTSK